MHIRTPHLHEIGEIHALDREEFGEDAYPRAFFRQAIDLWPSLILAAEDGGEIRGYAVAAPEEGRSTAWILAAVVTESYRGRGIGRAVVRALLERMAEMGFREVRLTVAPTNAGALHLYESIGFRRVGEEGSYFGDDEPRLVLGLEIGAPSA